MFQCTVNYTVLKYNILVILKLSCLRRNTLEFILTDNSKGCFLERELKK